MDQRQTWKVSALQQLFLAFGEGRKGFDALYAWKPKQKTCASSSSSHKSCRCFVCKVRFVRFGRFVRTRPVLSSNPTVFYLSFHFFLAFLRPKRLSHRASAECASGEKGGARRSLRLRPLQVQSETTGHQSDGPVTQ